MNKEKLIFLITVTICIIVLVVATTIGVILSKSKKEEEVKLDRSVFNQNLSGYNAWYKVITNSNVDITPWKKGFKSLKKIKNEDATMLIVSPEFIYGNTYVFTESDMDKLLDWVRVGNTLVFVDDFSRRSSRRFLKKLSINLAPLKMDDDSEDTSKDDEKWIPGFSVKEKDLYDETKTLYDIEGTDLDHFEIDTISTTSLVRLENKYLEPIIEDDDGVLLAKRQYGKGNIYIATFPDIVDNTALYDDEHNYQFFTNLIHIEDGKIYVNEYVHGNMKTDDSMSYYSSTLLNPIFKQCCLLLLILLWSASRRFGKIRPLKDSDRKTNIEYVNAIANLYNLAGLTGAALNPIYNQFRLNLCRDLRTDVKISDEDLALLIQQNYSNVIARELIDLINDVNQARTSNTISKSNMLELCRKMNTYRLKGSKYAKRS